MFGCYRDCLLHKSPFTSHISSLWLENLTLHFTSRCTLAAALHGSELDYSTEPWKLQQPPFLLTAVAYPPILPLWMNSPLALIQPQRTPLTPTKKRHFPQCWKCQKCFCLLTLFPAPALFFYLPARNPESLAWECTMTVDDVVLVPLWMEAGSLCSKLC